jgi:non-specific serine/threonine protein kinase
MTEAGIRRLVPEIGNLRAALGWALVHEPNDAVQLTGSLMNFWVFSVSLSEGRDWVERALRAAPDAPSRDRARALLVAGWLAMDHGDLPLAEASLTEAVARSRDVGDERLLFMCLLILGQAALKGNDLERARELFEEGRTLAVTGEPIHMAMATQSLGEVAMAMGDLATAQDLIEDALAIHQSGSGSMGQAFGHMYLGQVTLARADHTRAAACFRQAFNLFTEAGDLGSVPRVLEGLAGAALLGQPDQAARLLGAAAAVRGEDGWPRDQLEVPAYEQTLAMTRTALGEQAFDAAWDAGRQLSGEEVRAEIDALVATFASPPSAIPPETQHGLSPRELEVLRLLVEGRSNRGIGDTLSLSERTVENHVMHILSKLGVESRTAAATYAVRHGLA